MGGRYLVALGSNMRHHRHGPPRRVIDAALDAVGQAGITLEKASRTISSRPVGPSNRAFANAVIVVRSRLDPPELLATLQGIENDFGRWRRGQPWCARVLDLDIVQWSSGAWTGENLVVPHIAFRERLFVLGPASEIAGDWRDPVTGLTVRQLFARLTRRVLD